MLSHFSFGEISLHEITKILTIKEWIEVEFINWFHKDTIARPWTKCLVWRNSQNKQKSILNVVYNNVNNLIV